MTTFQYVTPISLLFHRFLFNNRSTPYYTPILLPVFAHSFAGISLDSNGEMLTIFRIEAATVRRFITRSPVDQNFEKNSKCELIEDP
jgi:hypothetical protein